MMKILQVLLHLALSAFEVICYGTFTILGAINEREQVASTGGLLVGSLGISAAFNRHTSGGLMGAASARQSVQSLLHVFFFVFFAFCCVVHCNFVTNSTLVHVVGCFEKVCHQQLGISSVWHYTSEEESQVTHSMTWVLVAFSVKGILHKYLSTCFLRP
jgi:hypothetical protein